MSSGATFAPGALAGKIDERAEALRRARVPARLLASDDALWGDDAARRAVAKNRLGWVRSAFAMRERAGELRTFAHEVTARGIRRVLLLGMGGSSLAPEVLARVCGPQAGGLPLKVLDDTSPAAVREAVATHDPATTLVVVSSKSGGTVEVASFERVFFARARAVLGERAGAQFVAITDPGTSLEAQAREKRYARVFTNPADIGGRYSVLSCFGLVPAALLGLDPRELCDAAIAEHDAFAREGAPGEAGSEALAIGAALGELARAGRDKLTLVLAPALAPLGAWVEQLVAESTGKDGRGILPVDGERLASPEAYGNDRVFVSVSLGAPDDPTARALAALEAAGHPVLRWQRDSVAQLGAEFLRWELVTAIAGAVIDVDPFDEPNVAEAKAATNTVLERVRTGGSTPADPARAVDGALELHVAPTLELGEGGAGAWARALARLARPGDYAAILAFLHRTGARTAAIERVRHAWRAAAHVATTVGYGPRYLHSTGQLHKGGPATGVFLQLTAEEGDEAIPGQSYGFRTLRDAQAAGDFDVLARRGRRVARVHVRGDVDAGLSRLAEAFEGVASGS
jgi:glucose-6-phosphate isomerase/transaldolase/glucose-6-phosphate isomerase